MCDSEAAASICYYVIHSMYACQSERPILEQILGGLQNCHYAHCQHVVQKLPIANPVSKGLERQGRLGATPHWSHSDDCIGVNVMAAIASPDWLSSLINAIVCRHT